MTQRSDDWLHLQSTATREQAEMFSAAMEASGALAVTLENAGEDDYYDAALPGEPLWDLQRVTGLYPGRADEQKVVEELQTAFPALTIQSKRLADQDWERIWLENFRPIEVGRGLWVCPSWLEPIRKEAINLRIDPGLAFGSGTHATTRLCLKYLSQADLDGKGVIDFGCGSGILAIAALKLGARRAAGIDLDQRALAASVENARRNDVGNRFFTCTPALAEPAELVIANILAATLVELQPMLSGLVKPGGTLLLSGILEGQQEEVESHYRKSFRFERRQQEEWMLLNGTKS